MLLPAGCAECGTPAHRDASQAHPDRREITNGSTPSEDDENAEDDMSKMTASIIFGKAVDPSGVRGSIPPKMSLRTEANTFGRVSETAHKKAHRMMGIDGVRAGHPHSKGSA
jgi:hypothetical protein